MRPHAVKRHKFTNPIGTNWDLKFWTPVNFEVEYFINEETEGALTDTVTYFSIFRFEVDLSLGVQCRNISIFLVEFIFT